MADRLVVRGAREHNLRDVSLDLPRDRLIVFTGLSGSGKSSLAFDTIYAEGQRRYVESLSAYARQFLGQMDKPDVDFIEGLSPAISIDQKSASRNPRSTVGTITEVYDYLRLLYARIGHPHCPAAGGRWPARPPSRSSTGSSSCPRGPVSRCWPRWCGAARGSTAPCSTTWPSRASPGSGSTACCSSSSERADVNLARYEMHTIEVVVDRLVSRANIRQRLTESIETALELTGGTAEVLVMNGDAARASEADEAITFSQHLACTHCGLSFEEPAPRSFSFNSPYGACPACDGLGTQFEVDPELVVPDDSLSLADGALAPWAGGAQRVLHRARRSGWPSSAASPSTPRGSRSRPRTRSSSSTGRAAARCTSPTRTASTASAPSTPSSKGSSRGCSAATASPSRTGRASRSSSTCARCPARPATGPASSRSRWPSRSAGATSSSCAACPSPTPSRPWRTLELTDREHLIADRVLQGSARAHAVPARRRARLPVPGPLGRHPRRAARRSASGWPARSAPAWSACSTCSTSPPSACTSATTSG